MFGLVGDERRGGGGEEGDEGEGMGFVDLREGK